MVETTAMAEAKVGDVFAMVARGDDPPAPYLCATMLQAIGENEKSAALFTKILASIEIKNPATEQSRSHAHG